MNLKTEGKREIQDKYPIQKPETKTKDIHRIIISKEAKVALDDLLKKANEGFEAGEITKSDIVNMLLMNAPRYMTDSDIKTLRTQHFDEEKVLTAILKGVAKGEQIPDSLKSALRSQYGLSEGAKRKAATHAPRPNNEPNETSEATPQQ